MTSHRYELLEHAADVMVRCTGKDLEECFENAAYAMFDKEVDVSCIANGELLDVKRHQARSAII